MESRNAPRTKINNSCILLFDDYSINCQANDISESGISFVMPPEIYIQLGVKIKYRFLMDDNYINPKSYTAQVVRISTDRERTIIGCQLI